MGAAAATAPALRSPGPTVDPFTEGGSIKFEWSGTLQGDSTALDRAFFRVEIIAAGKVPSGAQSVWSELENSAQTTPGSAATSITMGVPSVGAYRWRVCAWGVVNVSLENMIQQLPDGCSASRAFSTVAAAASEKVPGELRLEERRQVAGGTHTVYVRRPAAPINDVTDGPAEEGPLVSEDPVDEAEPEVLPASFQDVGDTTIESGAGSALSGVGARAKESKDALHEGGASGVTGAVFGALGANVPFLPVPFWTLALLLACAPILRIWRRSVLGMFEWDDGSIDGFGTMPDDYGSLATIEVISLVKKSSPQSDADDISESKSTRAPERRRHVA